jgi:hypothetical protein
MSRLSNQPRKGVTMPARGAKQRGGRIFFLAAVVALLCAAVAVAAEKPPPLASTSQYKAFVGYVKELDGRVGQATTNAQKGTYEAELTAKKEAAAHKANALFNRAAGEAEAEANAKFKEQQAAIRSKEGEELEAVEAEYGAKLEAAIGSYKGKLEKLEIGHNNYKIHVDEQIAGLRAEKAATPVKAKKDEIQGRITKKIEQIRANLKQEKEKRTALKTGFGKQKEQLHAAQDQKEAEIGEFADSQVEKSSKHWKGSFNAKKAKLNAKRESQLAYLNSKLEKGRADIASMPASG